VLIRVTDHQTLLQLTDIWTRELITTSNNNNNNSSMEEEEGEEEEGEETHKVINK